MGPFEIDGRLDAAGAPRYIAHKRDAPSRKLVLSVHDLDNADSARLSVDLQRARRVGHPGVALAELLVEDGQRILAIDRYDGLSVAALLSYLDTVSERLADAAICRIGCELMKAVAAAHNWRDDAGVVRPLVHGMLGPRQVHVSWTGEVRVLGFGLVALYRLAPDPPWDEGGAFLAPEVRAGRMATARADVYSAARLIWAMLTQRNVPEGLEPEPLTQVRPELDRRVAKAIDRALDPSTANRTIVCQEIAEELEQHADPMELEWNMELLRAVLPAGQEEACAEGVVTLIPFEADSSDKQPTGIHDLPKNVPPGHDSFDTEPPDSEDQPTAVMTLPKQIARPGKAPKIDDEIAAARRAAQEEATPADSAPVQSDEPSTAPTWQLEARPPAPTTLQGPGWQEIGKQLAAASAAETADGKGGGPRPVQLPPARSRHQTELGLGAKGMRAEAERALRSVVAKDKGAALRAGKPNDESAVRADKLNDERAARIGKAKEQRAAQQKVEPRPLEKSRVQKPVEPAKTAAKGVEPQKPAKPIEKAIIERKRAADKSPLDARRGKSLRTTLRSASSELVPEEAALAAAFLEPVKLDKPKTLIDKPEIVDPPTIEMLDLEPPPVERQTPEMEAPVIEAPSTIEMAAPELEEPAIEAPKIETPKIETPKIETLPRFPESPVQASHLPKVEIAPAVMAPKIVTKPMEATADSQRRERFVTPSLRAIDVLTASGEPVAEPKGRKSTLEATSHDTKPPPARGRWGAVLAFIAVAIVIGVGFAFGPRFFESTNAPLEPSARTDAPREASTPQPAASVSPPAPEASVEPPAEPSATPSASASAEAALDPTKLPPNKAQIIVEPPLPGIELWVNGVRAGPADETVVS
ncbi:MAG TPA: hypothetical protein VFB62_25685, partial [Polyangiaceae bacterium]|nr:hypothetical protein [Polyangiaceae bacterium]